MITQHEIMEAAKEADAFYVADKSDWHKVGYCVYVFCPEDLERFAAIIERKTIERCAIAANKAWFEEPCYIYTITDAIRKLGEQ